MSVKKKKTLNNQKRPTKSTSSVKREATKTRKYVTNTSTSTKVDYYPNRMMVAISVLAATAITLLGIMVNFT